jgi:hypothetical protein
MRRKPKEILGGRYLGCTGGKVVPPLGLWRSPVAHLVRIEGVRGSNPLSSTTFFQLNGHTGTMEPPPLDRLSAICPQRTWLHTVGPAWAPVATNPPGASAHFCVSTPFLTLLSSLTEAVSLRPEPSCESDSPRALVRGNNQPDARARSGDFLLRR